MLKNIDIISFVKSNPKYFKEFQVSIPICDKEYKFNILLITNEHIKLQLKLDYFTIFYSKLSTLEYSIKKIISEDDRYIFPDSDALAQRAVTNRNLRGKSIQVLVNNSSEYFEIKNVSQTAISIERTLNFDDFEKLDGNDLYNIIKIELIKIKPKVDAKLEKDNQDKLEKDRIRHQKQKEMEKLNTVYSKDELISVALDKKQQLKWNRFPIDVYGKSYSFIIEGIGDFAVKLGLSFSLTDIFYANNHTIEKSIKDAIDNVLKESYDSYDDFCDKLECHESLLDYVAISVLIGDEYFKFTIITYSYQIKLIQFVNYDSMMRKFFNKANCLETILKKHIENFKPKPFGWDYKEEFIVPKTTKKEYKHPTVSNKEDFEVVRKKINEKQKARKEYEKSRSYNSNNRSNDISRILR